MKESVILIMVLLSHNEKGIDGFNCKPDIYNTTADLTVRCEASNLCNSNQPINPIFIQYFFQFFLGNNTSIINCTSYLPIQIIGEVVKGASKDNVQQLKNIYITNIDKAIYTGKCTNIVTDVSVIYLGSLRQTYYPTPRLKLKNVHLALIQLPNKPLSIAAVGALYLCKQKSKCRHNAAAYVNQENGTTLVVERDFYFETAWVDSNFIKEMKRFKSGAIEQISRFNFNYFDKLILDSKSSQLKYVIGKVDDTMMIKDNNSTFTSVLGDVNYTEKELYENIDSEIFVCCGNFLGVYMKLKEMKLRHFAKILLPDIFHWILYSDHLPPWSEIIKYLEMNVFLLRGDFNDRKHSTLFDSTVYKAIRKYRFYEGLLVEGKGVIGIHAQKPSFFMSCTHFNGLIAYSADMFSASLNFHDGRGCCDGKDGSCKEFECIGNATSSICLPMEGQVLDDFNRFILNLNHSASNFTMQTERIDKKTKMCKPGTFRILSINMQFGEAAGGFFGFRPSVKIKVVVGNERVDVYTANELNLLSIILSI